MCVGTVHAVCVHLQFTCAPFVCELCYLLALHTLFYADNGRYSPTGIQWTRHYVQNLLFSFFLQKGEHKIINLLRKKL